MNTKKSDLVIDYATDQNISFLAGEHHLDMLKLRFPNSYERFSATTFFNRKSETLAEQSEEMLAIWYFRAALSQFQGILDLVTADMPSDLKQIWKRHEIKNKLDLHKLVSTMTRIRNLALHTIKLESTIEKREITFFPGGTRDVPYLKIAPITKDHFEQKYRPKLESLEWFNRQATFWSVNELLTEAAYILMSALENFVEMYSDHIVQQKDALDKIKRVECALSYE